MAGERGLILVVDDNRTSRLKLARSLEQQGHDVEQAEDGADALEMMHGRQFHVVLLDIVMPRMDGFQVLEQMKLDPLLRDIPVIVISAVEETDSIVRSIEMGAEDFLPKNFDPVLLRARLNASLQKKKLRDLEKAYLQQEITLRQSEKLATLGRLSAGMAHELNNPAAAAQRGAAQMLEVVSRLRRSQLRLAELDLSTEQVEMLAHLDAKALQNATSRSETDPLERSDRESELEDWLAGLGVEDPWEVAPTLVDLGYGVSDLEALAGEFTSGQLPSVVEWLSSAHATYSLLDEIREGAGRISEIVKALKAYTYMDQAPVQHVDLKEGIESTLVILRSKLKSGVTVHREYAPELPRIEAHGSELNQVWTNLIDNAIDAMKGRGEITVRTRHDGDWAIVEIEDNGPGIPEEIQSRVFDPFFTTKAPGEGTGMGLNIVHNIVQKHRGRIDLDSRPGKTRFVVRLPIAAVPAADGVEA
ncbi:MAG TPA: ATP-binding protein [Chloroflexota bacterium]